MKPTVEHVHKILELLSHGLVKGLGSPKPGEMCIEAAVNYALGLPHGDNPPCVGSEVRNYKIQLNDMPWSNNMTRANGMKQLAIAQLGSNTLDQEEFKKRIFELTQKEIVVLSFDYLKQEYRVKEHDELKEFCKNNSDLKVLKEKFKNYNYYYNYNNNNYNNYNYNNYNNYYYYNYYNYYYNYYNYYYLPEFLPILLHKSADIGVQVLKDMNCKGCQWLHLIKD